MSKFILTPATAEAARQHIAACVAEHGAEKINDEAARFFNAGETDIDSDGDVFIMGPMTGHWIGEDKLIRFAEALENGF